MPALRSVISQFHALKKPIGLCCIAPVLAAKVIPDVKVTIGTDEGTSKAISELGATNVPKQSTEVFIDTKNLVVTTPAYMLDSRISEVRKIFMYLECFAPITRGDVCVAYLGVSRNRFDG
jgi:enhancing lycopene biosynthesis protein 2